MVGFDHLTATPLERFISKNKAMKKENKVEKCIACEMNGVKFIDTDRLVKLFLRTVEKVGGVELRREVAERLIEELADVRPQHNHF